MSVTLKHAPAKFFYQSCFERVDVVRPVRMERIFFDKLLARFVKVVGDAQHSDLAAT
jgi:hypothetical protein